MLITNKFAILEQHECLVVEVEGHILVIILDSVNIALILATDIITIINIKVKANIKLLEVVVIS